MAEADLPSWLSDKPPQQSPIGNEVTISTLPNPPGRELQDPITRIIARRAKSTPGSLEPVWILKDLTDSEENIRFVPMNTSAQVRLDTPGYLTTANLNGCTAVTAAYRDGEDTVHAFLAHYDSESVRKTDEESGKLKICKLLTEFVGEEPVRVVVAYSKAHNLPPAEEEPYDPSDYPLEAIKKECKSLPNGSSILFIPYETSEDLKSPTIGHMLYVGRGGSDLIRFGWNGHDVEVGKPEQFDDKRKESARNLASIRQAEAEESYDDLA